MAHVKTSDAPRFISVGRLIDGTGVPPLPDALIEISDGAVRWVGPAAHRPDVPPDVCYPDAVAVPGFVDAHVHFTLFADGRDYEAMAAESDAVTALVAARNAEVHLRAGVTTARDNGSRDLLGFVLREGINRGIVRGPRLLVSGRPVTPSNGHFHWCHGVADTADQIEAAVVRLAGEGADHIKFMASGGGTAGSDPGAPTYTVPELAQGIGTAHRLGLLTTAHCRATESMARAIAAGVDCMEHGEFLAPDGTRRYHVELAARLIDSGVYLCPTLQANGWDTILRLRTRAGLTPDEASTLVAAERETELALADLHRLLDGGMGNRVIAGTDAGCFDFSFGHIDYCLGLMVAAGMSPMHALIAATSAAATACGVGDQVGSIEAGKRADLVILGADPLVDIAAVAEVRAIYLDGRLVC